MVVKKEIAISTVGEKDYNIDFFQISLLETNDLTTPSDGFRKILSGEFARVASTGGYTRDIWQLKFNKNARAYIGEFRKFRTSDLPEVGSAGHDARELDLEENQGIVERNFFIYYEKYQILAWHRNGHGSTANQFAQTLSGLFDTNVSTVHAVSADAVKRLMKGNVELKRIEFTIPRPSNPAVFSKSDFSKQTLEMMKSTGADSITLALGVDARKPGSEGKLSPKIKRALLEFKEAGASKAKAYPVGGDSENPIDLILDKITSKQSVETNARYPTSATMFKMIHSAMKEKEAALDEYFKAMNDVGD